MPRPPHIQHCTSEAVHFFGRQEEFDPSRSGPARAGARAVLALVGPGGQGKTAIVQHWLDRLPCQVDGLFFWSFYRGKEPRSVPARVVRLWHRAQSSANVSASYCVDAVLPILRQERWTVIFDGLEVVQHEKGNWFGRIQHPELGAVLKRSWQRIWLRVLVVINKADSSART